jgi:hypothetical protein
MLSLDFFRLQGQTSPMRAPDKTDIERQTPAAHKHDDALLGEFCGLTEDEIKIAERTPA